MNNLQQHKDLPWHASGLRLNSPQTAREAIREAGLDWKVVKKQKVVGPESRPAPEEFMLVREDLGNEKNGGLLAEVGPNYKFVQNSDAFTFFDPIVQAGHAFYDAAGSQEKGVWLLARLRGDIEITDNDHVGLFVRLGYGYRNAGLSMLSRINPVNPSVSPVLMRLRSGVTMVCRTFRRLRSFNFLEDELVPVYRAADGTPELREAPETVVQTLHKCFDDNAARFREMVRHRLNDRELRGYFDSCFFMPLKIEGREEEYDRAVTSRNHSIDQCIRLSVEGKGNDLPNVRGTLWAAYNAVMEHCSFHRFQKLAAFAAATRFSASTHEQASILDFM